MNGRRIYLVEDDLSLRRLQSKVLRGLPELKVHEFDYAEDALGRIEELKPAVMIVDLSLPGMNGVEFIVQARKRHGWVPVIVTTGDRETHEEALRELKGVEIWEKPYPIQDLRDQVRSLLLYGCGLASGG